MKVVKSWRIRAALIGNVAVENTVRADALHVGALMVRFVPAILSVLIVGIGSAETPIWPNALTCFDLWCEYA